MESSSLCFFVAFAALLPVALVALVTAFATLAGEAFAARVAVFFDIEARV
jgi:hypothetical protein